MCIAGNSKNYDSIAAKKTLFLHLDKCKYNLKTDYDSSKFQSSEITLKTLSDWHNVK